MDTSQSVPVDMGSLYDLASLTKVLSTGLAAMELHRRKALPLRSKLHTLLPELKGHPLGQRTLAALMTHQSGLLRIWPWINAWAQTQEGLSDGKK